MKILAIDTSCDDTCVAVTKDLQILSNVVSSQIELHKSWGGVVPNLAKRAHEERIETICKIALKKARERLEDIDLIAVTKGPGLAPCLQVGLDMAKALSEKYKKKAVVVNHIEGHILSVLLTAGRQKKKEIIWPALALTVSGGHTKLIWIEKIGEYLVLGETLDDAAGESLDKAAKMLGLGYPGGPVIEKLAKGGKKDFLSLPIPLVGKSGCNFSFSGLKTSFFYQLKDFDPQFVLDNLTNLAASFQNAVMLSLRRQTLIAIEQKRPRSLIAVGGVMSNNTMRKMFRMLGREVGLPIYFPIGKKLNTDNAAMIAAAAYFKYNRGEIVVKMEEFEREPRMKLN